MERPDERTLSPEAKEYISYLENRLENMSAMYKNLQKAHFGSKSEKQKRDILPEDCEQLSIFNEAEDAADAKANDPTSVPENTVEVKSHKRAKKRNREELLEGLPVEIHEYELPAEEMTCHRCGHALEKIGREYIRKECEYIPAQVKVHEYYRATYACRGCEDGTDECKDCERAGADNCGKCENRPEMILVKAEVPEEHRYFVTDGYAGYNKVTSGTRCGCWAHVRRKFLEAIPGSAPNSEQAQGSKAKEGFEFCEKLFMLEREFASLSPEERHAERKKQSRPILEAFWTWCSSVDALRNSLLSKAIGYATGQKNILGSFLLDGQIPISNNLDENAIRPFVMGRKNWLFCNTPNGAAASAAVYSIVETAKANGLDPYQYLKYLLERMPRANGRYSHELLDSLMPWNAEM